MKNNKRRSVVFMIFVLLIGLSSGYVVSTYAKYVSEIKDKQGTAVVAKWNFDEENKNTTIEVNLTNTYNPSTLVGDRIAPGTEGSFKFSLTNATTETGVDYTISFGDASGVPTNLKFYSDASYNDEIEIASETITGDLDAEDSTGDVITIYWKWDYETSNGDVADTLNGKDGGENGTKLVLPVTITGVQTQPVA